MAGIAEQMRDILENAFQPDYLEVIDQSDHHIGHAGHDGQGESHFKIVIKAGAFQNQPRVACHRMIYHELDELLKGRVHALAIKIKV